MPATDGLHGRTLARPSGSSSQPVASAPLLSTRSSRAVIGHLLARRVEDGPLDTVAAVTMLARQQPPRSIPRLPRRTLRFGVQLLVDRSESMRPFGSDQRQLIRAVQDLVGAEITEILYFTGSPMRGVADRLTRRPRRHTATANGKPLLLLTDFGIRRYVNCAPGAPRPEWETFFRRHTTTRLRPVALVPFRAELTPEWIGRRCRVVTWDRSTTATVAGGGSR